MMTPENDRPIRRLFATSAQERSEIEAIASKLKALRKGATLGDLGWSQLRDEGRK